MKKNFTKIRVIGAILAVVFVLSAMIAFTAVSASAATNSAQPQSSGHVSGITARTQDGYDWWYPWNWKAPYHPVI